MGPDLTAVLPEKLFAGKSVVNVALPELMDTAPPSDPAELLVKEQLRNVTSP